MTPGPFDIVGPVDFDNHDRAAAAARLSQRQIPIAAIDFRAAARHFVLDPDLQTAINMALAVGAPLLLNGAPGTGKTQVAHFLGEYFDLRVHDFQVKSTSTALELKYDFDAVAYLRSAQHPDASQRQDREEFLVRGPLWLAYDDPRNAVVLIDEIDKAPRDFPNDLLLELDKHCFAHPFDPKKPPIQAPKGRPPIVVITSNAERRLPDAFLRRCIVHHLDLTEDLVAQIVQRRSGDFPRLGKLAERAMKRFFELRKKSNLSRQPSTAELLAWLTILSARGTKPEELEVSLADLPALGALLKDRDDLQRL